ncbi:MAG TPA: helix-turn-helix transcriptional regulator [Alphaproteobacteria bacterium]|nr:helix-turn-helix transcriptional regulator [Alphaproteobacteria bacterium]
MNRIETIERDGVTYAVVPLDVYEDLMDELAAVRAYDRAQDTPKDDYLPAALVKRMLDGETALRLWREHRGLTQAALAERVGIGRPYLSQLETGARKASHAVLKALAEALRLTVDDLI